MLPLIAWMSILLSPLMLILVNPTKTGAMIPFLIVVASASKIDDAFRLNVVV